MRFSLLRLLILTAFVALYLTALLSIWKACGVTPGGGIVFALVMSIQLWWTAAGYLETQLHKLLPPHK